MAIYILFLQYIIYFLKEGKGKVVIVVFIGFIIVQFGIDKKIW